MVSNSKASENERPVLIEHAAIKMFKCQNHSAVSFFLNFSLQLFINHWELVEYYI